MVLFAAGWATAPDCISVLTIGVGPSLPTVYAPGTGIAFIRKRRASVHEAAASSTLATSKLPEIEDVLVDEKIWGEKHEKELLFQAIKRRKREAETLESGHLLPEDVDADLEADAETLRKKNATNDKARIAHKARVTEKAKGGRLIPLDLLRDMNAYVANVACPGPVHAALAAAHMKQTTDITTAEIIIDDNPAKPSLHAQNAARGCTPTCRGGQTQTWHRR